ncbi:HAD family hydrolase [Bradyrhizobium sp.]|jgi:HAD superfamily hydrolase (TIGR01509 family)|uniref:HAD family hydrolase n=1 Tax=Bradyrhizobium sp. TaxID=376 RepID=UPI002DDD65A5|nr:HAD family hydrolase [Bradyrhizobium sp.]HEV2155113.1 HAD family hydrolase [Bradyrhizobium sp.]
MNPIRPKPELIIFDCDGVLVDSELLSCRCLSDELSEFGISLTLAQALELFLGRSVSAVVQHYRELGRTVPVDFPVRLKARVLAAFRAALRPIPDVDTVLSDLRMPRCVASSSDLDRVVLSLDVTGLAPHFGERIYTAQMVERGKPAPDLFLYAASKMGAQPARTLVIEDSVSGVQAAKAAGMIVWGFVGGSHYPGRDGHAILSAAGADRVFARMSDFWKEA